MSLFAELQRRNVIRVAIAYLAGAWLILQVADTLLPAYGFGDAAIRIIVGLLIVGFIPAVVTSWVFELTPEGLKRESEVDRSQSITHSTGKKLDRAIIVVLALALIYFAFDSLVLTESRIESAVEQARTDALVESYGDKSIAVLPFVDMSAEGDQEYMGDGVAEELLNLLAQVRDLRVISRSSSFSFKGTNTDIGAIADQLNVAHVLEGSVRKAGNTVRITAQLIDARSDTHLWSANYDRELTDIFAIQDEIAATVVEELKVALLGDAPTLQKTDPAAYELFLQARFLHEDLSPTNVQTAIDRYTASLAIDDSYVPAWVWLASAYADAVTFALIPPGEANALLLDTARKAVDMAPDDPLANGLYGSFLATYSRDPAGIEILQQALNRDPANLKLLRWAGIMLTYLGRPETAITVGEFILDRDPLGKISRVRQSQDLVAAARYEDAIKLAESSLVLFPEDSLFLAYKAVAVTQHADGASIIEAASAFEGLPERLMLLAVGNHLIGRSDASIAVLTELDGLAAEGHPLAPAYAAIVYAHIDDIDGALKWTFPAIGGGLPAFALFLDTPLFENFLDDPRWNQVLETIGRDRETLDAIEFEVTLPQ